VLAEAADNLRLYVLLFQIRGSGLACRRAPARQLAH
jgi:hypothetical protein